MSMRIKIDGEKHVIDEVFDGGYLPLVRCGRMEFYVAENSDAAGKAARRYWADMAENDPKEFACIVGAETLIQWGMGHYAGPGTAQVRSLQEWLDVCADYPEEEFGSYDGQECEVEAAGARLREELGFRPTVAYRHN